MNPRPAELEAAAAAEAQARARARLEAEAAAARAQAEEEEAAGELTWVALTCLLACLLGCCPEPAHGQVLLWQCLCVCVGRRAACALTERRCPAFCLAVLGCSGGGRRGNGWGG